MSSVLDDLSRARAVMAEVQHPLDDIERFLCRFVAYPTDHARVAHVLWIIHAHLMDAFDSTPRLCFLSPEPASGKSRALEITALLVPRPVQAINVTPAYLFRKVADPKGPPTVLYDEIDTVFGPKARDANEEIRGLLNAGHRKGAKAGRCVCVGKTVTTEELDAYCPVALAGLGELPDTILTRSVVVRMRRRAPGEVIEPFRQRDHGAQAEPLRERIESWAVRVAADVGEARPAMPTTVVDRDADVWEPLLAVADAAGADWPARARNAAEALVAQSKQSTPSLGVRLLVDLRQLFGERPALATKSIVDGLCALEEAPWSDMKGKKIDARRLSQLLKPYGIVSKNVRDGTTVYKGYERGDMHDAWQRYLAPTPHAGATAATPASTRLDLGSGAVVAPVAAATAPWHGAYGHDGAIESR